jgi:nitrogen fixation NifU-like protein
MSRYSPTLMDHFQSPRNAADLEDADLVGRVGAADSPPYMLLKLKLESDVVARVSFRTFGCGTSIACGSALGELVKGRSLDDCGRLSVVDVVAALDGVPDDKRWCADLAVSALKDALGKVS